MSAADKKESSSLPFRGRTFKNFRAPVGENIFSVSGAQRRLSRPHLAHLTSADGGCLPSELYEEYEVSPVELSDLSGRDLPQWAGSNVLDSRTPLRQLSMLEEQDEKSTTAIGRFWKRHVRVVVPHLQARDHLALERTYLSYLRTSLAFANTAVLVAQLLKLRNILQYEVADRIEIFVQPLAAVLIITAALLILVGAARFWRQQQAMVRGSIHAGGFEVLLCLFLFSAVSVALFVAIMVAESGELII